MGHTHTHSLSLFNKGLARLGAPNAIGTLASGARRYPAFPASFPRSSFPSSLRPERARLRGARSKEEEEEEKAAPGRSQTRRRIQARLCSYPPASPAPEQRRRERTRAGRDGWNSRNATIPGCVKPAGLKMAREARSAALARGWGGGWWWSGALGEGARESPALLE